MEEKYQIRKRSIYKENTVPSSHYEEISSERRN